MQLQLAIRSLVWKTTSASLGGGVGIVPGVFATPRLPFLPGVLKAPSQPLEAAAVTTNGLTPASQGLLVDVSPGFTVCGRVHVLLPTFSAGSMGSSAGGGVRRGWLDAPPNLAISWLCGKLLEHGPKPRGGRSLWPLPV